MSLLEILTPEQIRSLSPEQLLLLTELNKTNTKTHISKLKTLFSSLSCGDYGIDVYERSGGWNNNPKPNPNRKIINKIIKLLNDNHEKYYIVCSNVKAKSGFGNNETHKYKIYTCDEISEYIKICDIEKIIIPNVASFTVYSNSNGRYDIFVGSHYGPYETYDHYSKSIYEHIVSKVNNVHIINPIIFRALGYFQNNLEDIDTFLNNMSS